MTLAQNDFELSSKMSRLLRRPVRGQIADEGGLVSIVGDVWGGNQGTFLGALSQGVTSPREPSGLKVAYLRVWGCLTRELFGILGSSHGVVPAFIKEYPCAV